RSQRRLHQRGGASPRQPGARRRSAPDHPARIRDEAPNSAAPQGHAPETAHRAVDRVVLRQLILASPSPHEYRPVATARLSRSSRLQPGDGTRPALREGCEPSTTQGRATMPAGSSKKRERQYEHIKESYQDRGVSKGEAEERAARTVNKERRQ